MIRELRHIALALIGRVPIVPPVICPNGHLKRYGSKIEAARLGRKQTIRCTRCYQPMRAVNHPSTHISRAAAYYGDGEQP